MYALWCTIVLSLCCFCCEPDMKDELRTTLISVLCPVNRTSYKLVYEGIDSTCTLTSECRVVVIVFFC